MIVERLHVAGLCNALGMSRIVQVRLVGAEARPGHIAAADVARVILGLERALARAAYLVLGRVRQGATGRHTGAVEAASRLRFVGTRAGSLVELLALPDATLDSNGFDLPVDDLSRRAFDRLVAFIQTPADDADAQLAAAVAQLADELGIGERTDSLTLGEPDPARPSAVVDLSVRQGMRQIAQRPAPDRDDLVVGTLFEADFERLTARLRMPAGGGTVTVTFPATMADAIQQALRSEAQLEGRVRYDARTGTATSIETRAVTHAEQLLLHSGDWPFGENLSVAELQHRQGVDGRVNVADLAAHDLTEDERDAFVAALSGT